MRTLRQRRTTTTAGSSPPLQSQRRRQAAPRSEHPSNFWPAPLRPATLVVLAAAMVVLADATTAAAGSGVAVDAVPNPRVFSDSTTTTALPPSSASSSPRTNRNGDGDDGVGTASSVHSGAIAVSLEDAIAVASEAVASLLLSVSPGSSSRGGSGFDASRSRRIMTAEEDLRRDADELMRGSTLRQRRRLTAGGSVMSSPPLPVTPFRGGLKTVLHDKGEFEVSGSSSASNSDGDDWVRSSNGNDSNSGDDDWVKWSIGNNDNTFDIGDKGRGTKEDTTDDNARTGADHPPPPSSSQSNSAKRPGHPSPPADSDSVGGGGNSGRGTGVNGSRKSGGAESYSWTPEDYPDPWTNPLACAGAATAMYYDDEEGGGEVGLGWGEGESDDEGERSAEDRSGAAGETEDASPFFFGRNSLLSFRPSTLGLDAGGVGGEKDGVDEPPRPQPQERRRRRLLFCDPDSVLDIEALQDVAVELRHFSDAFTYPPTPHSSFDPPPFDVRASVATASMTATKTIMNTGNSSDTVPVAALGGFAFPPPLPPKATAEENLQRLENYASNGGGGNWAENEKGGGDRRKVTSMDVVPGEIEVAIALVRRINLPAILRTDSYFFYSDQDDMVNDAAQFFARYVHDAWLKRLAQEDAVTSSTSSDEDGTHDVPPRPSNIVLIFISTEDRICYISSGSNVAAVLPWWRLEHVVQDMKPDLRRGRTGAALSIAVENLADLLLNGPPTLLDRADDFVERFGIVLAFTLFTFILATWGECRDRRKRIFFVERRSRMSKAEAKTARSLQKEYKTKACPICLEPFDLSDDDGDEDEERPNADNKFDDNVEEERSDKKKLKNAAKEKRIDDEGIPLVGTDDQPIKILRCGHIFDDSCWRCWVDLGTGNPWICPVCRQDVGGAKMRGRERGTTSTPQHQQNSDEFSAESGGGEGASTTMSGGMDADHTTTLAGATPSTLLRPVGHAQYPSYDSVSSLQSPWSGRGPRDGGDQTATGGDESLAAVTGVGGESFTPLQHPTFGRLHPTFGRYAWDQVQGGMESIGEDTPLFLNQIASIENEDDY